MFAGRPSVYVRGAASAVQPAAVPNPDGQVGQAVPVGVLATAAVGVHPHQRPAEAPKRPGDPQRQPQWPRAGRPPSPAHPGVAPRVPDRRMMCAAISFLLRPAILNLTPSSGGRTGCKLDFVRRISSQKTGVF